MWRRPRTQQERRLCCNTEYRELGVRIRAKRSLRSLVHVYLDLPRQRHRSWKEQRKTRWKLKEIAWQSSLFSPSWSLLPLRGRCLRSGVAPRRSHMPSIVSNLQASHLHLPPHKHDEIRRQSRQHCHRRHGHQGRKAETPGMTWEAAGEPVASRHYSRWLSEFITTRKGLFLWTFVFQDMQTKD